MIIKSTQKFNIGCILIGYNDCHGNYQDVAFQILEEVTKEDYINEVSKECKDIGFILDCDHFYRIFLGHLIA